MTKKSMMPWPRYITTIFQSCCHTLVIVCTWICAPLRVSLPYSSMKCHCNVSHWCGIILEHTCVKNWEYFYNIVTKCTRQVGNTSVSAGTPTWWRTYSGSKDHKKNSHCRTPIVKTAPENYKVLIPSKCHFNIQTLPNFLQGCWYYCFVCTALQNL